MKIAIALFSLASALQFASAAADQKTVNGWVLDSACALTKGLDKPISRDCALACARNGSPLVILEDDGTIVWPVSDTMPAKSQNAKLVPYAGKRVTVTGKMYAKGGSQAIVMQDISAEKK
jgi:hypothetical protein